MPKMRVRRSIRGWFISGIVDPAEVRTKVRIFLKKGYEQRMCLKSGKLGLPRVGRSGRSRWWGMTRDWSCWYGILGIEWYRVVLVNTFMRLKAGKRTAGMRLAYLDVRHCRLTYYRSWHEGHLYLDGCSLQTSHVVLILLAFDSEKTLKDAS